MELEAYTPLTKHSSLSPSLLFLFTSNPHGSALMRHNDVTAWHQWTLKWRLMTDLWWWPWRPTSFWILNDTRCHWKKWLRHDDLAVTVNDAAPWQWVIPPPKYYFRQRDITKRSFCAHLSLKAVVYLCITFYSIFSVCLFARLLCVHIVFELNFSFLSFFTCGTQVL